MDQPTIEELNEQYKGQCILVFDETHPDYGKKCEFVEMVRRPFEKYPLMKVRIMKEGRFLELKAKQVFFIVQEIPLPGPKDN